MTDYIYKQAAIEALNKELEGINEVLTSITLPYHDKERQRQRKGQVKEDIRAIESVPSADVEPVRHGRWIVVSDGYGNGDATAHICECSECKDTIWVYKKATRRWNYCPNCGAKMNTEEGEEA